MVTRARRLSAATAVPGRPVVRVRAVLDPEVPEVPEVPADRVVTVLAALAPVVAVMIAVMIAATSRAAKPQRRCQIST